MFICRIWIPSEDDASDELDEKDDKPLYTNNKPSKHKVKVSYDLLNERTTMAAEESHGPNPLSPEM